MINTYITEQRSTIHKENNMGRPLKIAKSTTSDTGLPSQTQPGNIGVVGGPYLPPVDTLLVGANIEYAPGQYTGVVPCYIVRQKGEYKYIVASVNNPEQQGICYVVNIASADTEGLAPGEMFIIGTDAASQPITLAKIENLFTVAYKDQSRSIDGKSKKDITLGQPYWASFISADANLQSGSLTPPGTYPIIKLGNLGSF